ncbi:MAG: hypothetical protein R3A48_12460 [Polyangiales bacterium]
MSWRRSALVALSAGCAAAPTRAPREPTVRSTLPAARRASPTVGEASSARGPVEVRVRLQRDDAESLREALTEGLRAGDDEVVRSLLADQVEGAEGERVAGRERVVALLRAWQPLLVQTVGRGTPGGFSSRVFSRGECTPSLCGETYLRDGDWFMRLDHPVLDRRQVTLSRLRRAAQMGAPGRGSPPRFFVIREVGGRLRVVAMNDDFFDGS